MKKIVFIIIPIVIVGGISGYLVYRKKLKSKLPTTVDIKLPTGEVVKAIRVPWPKETKTPVVPSEKTPLILEGIIKWEEHEYQKISSLILETETGTKYVMYNPKYENLLAFQAVNKKVKIKCVTAGTSSFKNYPAVWIDEVLEIAK